MNATIDQLMQAVLSGDPAPLVAAFRGAPARRAPLLRRLLEAEADAPVAACFAALWQELGAEWSEDLPGLLRWYLRGEAATRAPKRSAVHRAVLLQLFALQQVPDSDAGFDLAFAAVRLAADRPAPLALRAKAEGFLQRVAGQWLADPDRPVTTGFLHAALATASLGLLRQGLDRAAGAPRVPELRHALDWALNMLITLQGGVDPWLARTIAREFLADPESPAAVWRKLWLDLGEGARLSSLAPLLRAMRLDPAEPQLKAALQFGYAKAREEDLPDLVDWLHDQLLRIDPAWVEGYARRPAAAPEKASEAVTAGPDGALAGALAGALQLADAALELGASPSARDIALGFEGLAAAVDLAPVPPGWTVQTLLQAAESLVQLTRRQYGWITHFVEAPHAQGARQYGTIDLTKFPALHEGLLRVAAAMAQAGLAHAKGGAGVQGVWTLARLIQLQTQVLLDLRQPAAALAALDDLAARGVLRDLIAILRDDARLGLGDLAAARLDPPPSRAGTRVQAYLSRPEWSEAEAVTWKALAEDPVVTGRFEVVWPDGRLQVCPHATMARELSLARVDGLSVLAEGLLIGPAGHVLRPDAYHTSRDYPRTGSVVVAAQDRALRLRPRAEVRDETPVMVLEASAALHWPNYYHWMIPHLSRVALAQERGLMQGRKLVLPQGLRPWMHETLDLIGLAQADRLILPVDQWTRFEDALVLGSIEHLSQASLRALRRRMLGAGAEVDRVPKAGPCYFLSRRSRSLRKLANEDEIEDIARSLGFTVLAPEDYTVAEQVQLFAGARGIAAPEGAAMTNTLFAAPGAKILAFVCQNDMLPVFNDLSLVLGHRHRKMAGAGLDEGPGGIRFQPDFRVDLGLARQSLAWVLDD